MKKTIIMVVVSIVVVGAVFWIGAKTQREKEIKKTNELVFKNKDKLIRDHSPSLGPEDARVVLVEFLDPECEACRAMHPIVKRLLSEYSDTVRLVIRYMPLHGNSVYAANVLEIARNNNKYWEALDVFFEKQPEWGSHHKPRPELLKKYMAEMSIDLSPMESVMMNEVILRRIEQDRSDGLSLGVRGTPSFFVNGKKLRKMGYEPLKKAIDEALSQDAK